MNFNLNYESPLLEIIKVQVEQGYQYRGYHRQGGYPPYQRLAGEYYGPSRELLRPPAYIVEHLAKRALPERYLPAPAVDDQGR